MQTGRKVFCSLPVVSAASAQLHERGCGLRSVRPRRENEGKQGTVRSVRARRCGVAFPHISYTAGDVEEPYAAPGEGTDGNLQVLGGVWRRPVGGRHAAAGVLVDELVGPVQAGAAYGPRHKLGRRLWLRWRPGDVARATAQRRGARERRRPRARRGRLRRVPRVHGRAARRPRREAAVISVGHAGLWRWPHELLGALRTLACQLRRKSRLRSPSHARFLWRPHVVAGPAGDGGRS